MKLSADLAVNFHWGLLRGVRDFVRQRFGHAPESGTPVRSDRLFHERARWFEFVSRDEVAERLCGAAAQGDTARVRHLLRHPLSDPNAAVGGVTATRLAAEAGHLSTLETLLDDRRTDPSISDSALVSPLHAAVAAGREKAVGLLLGRGSALAKLPDIEGLSPWLQAVAGNQADIVLAMVRKGVDPRQIAPNGLDAIGLAIACNSRDALRVLLDTLHVDLLKPSGLQTEPAAGIPAESPIETALRLDRAELLVDMLDHPAGRFQLRVTPQIMDRAQQCGARGCLAVLQARRSTSPLEEVHAALEQKFGRTTTQSLTRASPTPAVEPTDAATGGPHETAPLFAAIENHDLETLCLLIADDPNCVNAADEQGVTPLMIAARCNAQALELLLSAPGILPAKKDAFGWSALLHAIEARQACHCEILMADPRVDLDHASTAVRLMENDGLAATLAQYERDLSLLSSERPEQLIQHYAAADPQSRTRMIVSAQRWLRQQRAMP